MNEQRLITAENITKNFPSADGEVSVLKGITMTVNPGEMISVVGPSGSGKSTLLYCISGLDNIPSGQLMLMGQDANTLNPTQLAELRKDHFSFVFQSYNLVPSMTAYENIELALELRGMEANQAKIDQTLSQLGLDSVSTHLPSELSGGQQQRVAIARALLTSAKILFADEPTGALDGKSSDDVLKILRGYTNTGNSTVMVTHDLEAAAIADRVLILRDGKIHDELQHPNAQDVFDAVEAAKNAGNNA